MSVNETDPNRHGFPAVGNIGSNPVNSIPKGIFVTGFNDIRSDAGTDQVIGTADDTGTALTQMQREIVITDVCDLDRPSYNCPTPGTSPVKIRTVQVNIRYFIGALPRTERVTTVLTDYALAD